MPGKMAACMCRGVTAGLLLMAFGTLALFAPMVALNPAKQPIRLDGAGEYWIKTDALTDQ